MSTTSCSRSNAAAFTSEALKAILIGTCQRFTPNAFQYDSEYRGRCGFGV